MTVSKKESDLAKRIVMWFSVGRIVWGAVIAGAIFGVRVAESYWVRPYVANVVKCEYDTLHAPADCKIRVIGCQIDTVMYQLALVRAILEVSQGDSVLAVAKKRTDARYWSRGNF